MNGILQHMNKTPTITTNTASYNIVLQYFAHKGMTKEMEDSLDLMEKHGVRRNLWTLSKAVTAYLITQKIDRAEEFLNMMIAELQNNVDAVHQQRLVSDVLRKLFVTYLELMKESHSSRETKEELFKRAFALFQSIQNKESHVNLLQGK
jgi:pentatricopeptide repeat protein